MLRLFAISYSYGRRFVKCHLLQSRQSGLQDHGSSCWLFVTHDFGHTSHHWHNSSNVRRFPNRYSCQKWQMFYSIPCLEHDLWFNWLFQIFHWRGPFLFIGCQSLWILVHHFGIKPCMDAGQRTTSENGQVCSGICNSICVNWHWLVLNKMSNFIIRTKPSFGSWIHDRKWILITHDFQ